MLSALSCAYFDSLCEKWSGGMEKDEMASVIVLFLFGAVTALLSLRMPIGTFRMAGTGMFPLILGIFLMILSGAFVLRILFQGEGEQVRKEASVESSESPMQLILFLGAMVLATFFFQSIRISADFFPFDVGPPENPGDETVGSKHSDLCGDGWRFLFFVRQVA